LAAEAAETPPEVAKAGSALLEKINKKAPLKGPFYFFDSLDNRCYNFAIHTERGFSLNQNVASIDQIKKLIRNRRRTHA
jgi:hypothetical protein